MFAGKLPVIARNGDTFAAAWLEWRPSGNGYDRQRVLVRRVDARGNALDAEPVVLWDRTSDRLLPDIPGLAIGAGTDGFRVAWLARPPAKPTSVVPPPQALYTTHIGASGAQFAEPALVEPSYIRTFDPVIVSDGADSLLLFRQGDSTTATDVYAHRYVDGAPHSTPMRLAHGSKFGAAVHAGELLLAHVRADGVGRYCTDAQRFSLTGAPLAPAVTLDCRAGYEPYAAPSAVWDNDSWWIAPGGREVVFVHRMSADGTVREPVRFFADETPSLATSLVATGANPSAAYVRVAPALDLVERGFFRTYPRPRSRAVRH
jgi:hypothetical protein